MESRPYDDRSAARGPSRSEAPRERSLGEHVFVWIGWALAAAFWGATMTTFWGILRSVSHPTPGGGGADAGGVLFAVMDVVGGLIVLGAALAYGSWMFARRNRALDPVTEARTAALYDSMNRPDGEDSPRRSADRGRPERDFR